MAKKAVAFCHICKKEGHTHLAHRKGSESVHGSNEGFTGRAFHGHVEGSIWHGTLRKK